MSVIDIKTRKPIEQVEFDAGTSAAQFFNLFKRRCKEEKTVSAFVLTISEDNHCDWGMITDSEYHLLLAFASLRDLENEILDNIFPQNVDVELDE